jgi:uncharacterized protein YndB with AHSA1/START domain
MSSLTEVAVAETNIVMSRVYDAPRELVWEAMTQPKHIKRWWGGPGFTNPVCEMDVRPGGLWHHVMRFPDGHELQLDFVFLEVEPPSRLVWRHVDHGIRGRPTCRTSVTLDDLGGRTRWRMVAEFNSPAECEAAVAIGFSRPIEASNLRLVEYLKTMQSGEET